MFTSLSKIICWSPNLWCDGVMVHEVFDRVLARLGLERGNIAGSSHVTAQSPSNWPHRTLVSHSQGTEYQKWMLLTLLSLLSCSGSSWRHNAVAGCLPTGWPPNGINILNYACMSFLSLFKKLFGATAIGISFKKFSIPLTLSVLCLLPCTLYRELHYRHTHGCLPFLKFISQDNVTHNKCWVQICA